MITIDEMKNEIRQYCLNLILNSNPDEWVDDRLTRGNIIIHINDKSIIYAFEAHIYDNSLQQKNVIIDFRVPDKPTLPLFLCAHKKRSQERRIILKKHKEIYSYLSNKSEYESMLKTYNLLPIKELRKKKLNNINKEI